MLKVLRHIGSDRSELRTGPPNWLTHDCRVAPLYQSLGQGVDVADSHLGRSGVVLRRDPRMSSRRPIGIMQGRLSPRFMGRYQAFPPDSWREEFVKAHRLGFDYMECIFDYDDYRNNPLFTDEGLAAIREIKHQTGLQTPSVCADYFMQWRLHDPDKVVRERSQGVLRHLMGKVASVACTNIIIPCVDEASLKDESEVDLFKGSLSECLPEAERNGVDVSLETDLPPGPFIRLVEDLNHSRIRINYDTGNSAALGYDPTEEIAAYGPHISVLHVKDRVRNGGSVKLGTGDVNFEMVFRALRAIGFNGIITMQAARAEHSYEEVDFVCEQFSFLKGVLQQWLYANGA